MTTLTGKVAIVTGGNSGIGKAVVLALAEEGANIVIDYVANEQATEDLEKKVAALGDQSIGVDADVSKVEDLERLVKSAVDAFGRARHHGQQRRRRDPHVDSRHHRGAVREGDGDQPQERLLRNTAGGQADDRPGRRGSDHQHHLGARGLADARQHRLLPLQGRDADADSHGRRRARSPRHHASSGSARVRSPRRSTSRR